MLKMDTRIDGSVLAVLAAYQNNLVTSKTMTTQGAQGFRSESVKPRALSSDIPAASRGLCTNFFPTLCPCLLSLDLSFTIQCLM